MTTTAPSPAPVRGTTRAGGPLVAFFVLYLALLVWVVLWKLGPPWVGDGATRTLKLVPFVATAHAGASAPAEVAVNAILFAPFGAYLALLAPRWRWWAAATVVAGASVALEAAQYVLAVGRSDSTDVLANTAGGLVGIGLVAWARSSRRSAPEAAVRWGCAAATVLGLLASAFVVVGPLTFSGPAGGHRVHRSVVGGRPGEPPGAARPRDPAEQAAAP